MEKFSIKKLWASARFKAAGTVSLIGGLIVAGWFFVKEPGKKPDTGVVVNQDTVIHVIGDSIRTDSGK